MKALADYIHSKGLYFGLYTCVGVETCRGGRPGSYDHWEQDANTFAEWYAYIHTQIYMELYICSVFTPVLGAWIL